MEIEFTVRCTVDDSRSIVSYTNHFNERMKAALKDDLLLFYHRITAARLLEPKEAK